MDVQRDVAERAHTTRSAIRPVMTLDKISIRCRSRSLIAINPISNLPDILQSRGV